MKIKVNTKNLDSRIDFLNENNKLLYWTIYDFSYKRRMRIFNDLDIEQAYVRLKIETLNNDIALYDLQDNLLEKFNENNLFGNIEELKLDVKKDNELFMHIEKNDNECEINVFSENILSAIMYMIVILDLHKENYEKTRV